MKRPTDAEIRDEISWLKANKSRVRKTNGFGDDLHARIDVQIEVLQRRLDPDEIWQNWSPENEDDPGEDASEHLYDAAMEASNWMEGEDVDTGKPSDGWKKLIR